MPVLFIMWKFKVWYDQWCCITHGSHATHTYFLHTRRTLPHDYAIIYKNKLLFLYMYTGFEPGRAIAPIPHCNWNCSFKKRPRGQFVPFKILGKNSKGSTHEEIYFSTKIASWNRTWKVYFIAPLKLIPKLRFSHVLLLFLSEI